MHARFWRKLLLLGLVLLVGGLPPLAPTEAWGRGDGGANLPPASALLASQDAEAGPAGEEPQVLSRKEWISETIDSLGTVGQYTSIALDAQGFPHIAYSDESNADLKYAYQDTSGWHFDVVDTAGAVGSWCSLALDASGDAHISYMLGGSVDLKYARYVGSGGSGCATSRWNCETVDSAGNVGFYSSLAVDTAGDPHISYYNSTGSDLKYAWHDSIAWHIETAESASDVGYYSSLVLDVGGWPRISHYDAINGDLRYTYKDASGWHSETVDDTPDVGIWTSIALDPLSGVPAISYVDRDWGRLKYAYRVGAGGNCPPTYLWNCEEVTPVGSSGGHTSLVLDGNGQPHISYYFGPDDDLMYAYYDGGAWQIEAVDAPAPPATVGQYTSLALDEDFGLHISYYAISLRDLKYASGCKKVKTASINGPGSLLVGQEGTYTASYLPPAATRPITVTWDNGTVGPSAVYSWTQAGEYPVHITVTNPCGEAYDVYTVTVCQPVQAVAIAGPDFLLTGDEGTYSATVSPPDSSAPLTIAWDNGTFGETADYSWDEPGVYTISVTATNPCGEVHDVYTVTVCQPVQTVAIAGPTFLRTAEEGAYTATVSPPDSSAPLTIAWDNGTFGPYASYSWAEPGNYTIRVTATNACGEVYDTHAVEVCQPVEAVAIAGPTFLLTGQEGTYNADVSPPDSSTPLTIAWDNGAFGNPAYYSWAEPGDYTIHVTATNDCGEVYDSHTVEVCQPVEGVTVAGPPFLLVDQPGLYTATVSPDDSSEPLTIAWDNGTVGQTAYYSWAEPDVYIIHVTATNACGQQSAAYTVSVGVCQPLEGVSIAGPRYLLPGEPGTYTAGYLPPTATLPVATQWDNGATGSTAVYSWTEPAVYTISVTATNPCGDAQGSYTVTVCQALESAAVSGPSFVVVGEEYTYTATYAPPTATLPLTMAWNNGATGPAAVYSWTEAGTHTVAVTVSGPCNDVSGMLAVEACQPLQGVSVAGPISRTVGQAGIYTASYAPVTATWPVTFTWDNGTLGPEATYSWTAPGRFTIVVTATNACQQVSVGTEVAVFDRIYLPLVINWWSPCFLGPQGFVEHEPNNYWLEANGPMCSEVIYTAVPSDADDLFTFNSAAGPICVYVAEYAPGCNGVLMLYDADYGLIGSVALCGGSGQICAQASGGLYYIRVYTAEFSETPYKFWATFPRR